jgi:hypothetical protein
VLYKFRLEPLGNCVPYDLSILTAAVLDSSSPSAGDGAVPVRRRVCCCAELFQEKSHERVACTVCRHAVTPRFSLLTTIDLSGCKANTCAVCRYASMHTRSLWLAAFLRATANMHRGNHFARRESDALATIVRAQLWPCTNISMVTQAPDRSWCSIQRAELHSPPTVASMSGTAKQPRCTPLSRSAAVAQFQLTMLNLWRQCEVGRSQQQSNNHAHAYR